MTDEEIIRRARSGDRYAQEEILNKYSNLVHAIAARFFLHGGENEDLVQEGMVGLYSAINGFEEGGANFSSYAYACIRNAVLSAIKKSLGAKNAALNDFVPIVEIGEEISPVSPEDEVIRRDNRREFLQKISKTLSSTEFKTIVMHLDGMSVAEISAALGKPQKSVSNALARAKAKLEKLYEKED